jgi:hypothetical protein
VINELVGPDQSPIFKALNEGSADYFSSSFLDDPVMAEYAAKIFNSRNTFLHRTDNNNRWPYNVVGEGRPNEFRRNDGCFADYGSAVTDVAVTDVFSRWRVRSCSKDIQKLGGKARFLCLELFKFAVIKP